jgi:glycosyltransferase involved in cell wall biosynthesis
MFSAEPTVTCLCLTRNRRDWLPHAIDCFMAQTYWNRELLIVADAESDYAGLLPASPMIRAGVTGPGKVGAKRNAGCEEARGEVIAIWDDDDHSEPGRLAGQVAQLVKSGKAVTGYHSMKFTDGKRWWHYRTLHLGFAMPTSLCFTKAYWAKHHFEDMQSGQDEAFVTEAVREKQLAAQGDLDLMYATIHPGNTSPRPVKSVKSGNWIPLENFQWQAN